MVNNTHKILLLAKKTEWCDKAVQFLKDHWGENIVIVQGEVSDPFPSELYNWQGEIIISFLSPWIIPKAVLDLATKAAMNFHPAPPEYPGTGCYNFALYEDAKQYGVTCHYMKEKVDTGDIIATKYFPVVPEESVYSLKEKSMQALLDLLKEIVNILVADQPLPRSELHWTRMPFTRKQLNELCRITLDMDDAEARRRVRAAYFPGAPGPFIEFGGCKFEFKG